MLKPEVVAAKRAWAGSESASAGMVATGVAISMSNARMKAPDAKMRARRWGL